MPLPKVGKTAPAFSLLDQDGNNVSLKDFKSKTAVLLFFYPKAMTPGCTVQAKSLKASSKKLKAAKLTVLGVSIDPVKRLDKFREKEKLDFTLLSDEDHKVCSLYGVWQKKKFMGREFMGIVRTSFIIGKDGKIKHVMDKVNTKTHHGDVLSWVNENLK